MIFALLSSPSASWWLSEAGICIVAGIGGILVFAGLWIEGPPKEGTFSDIGAFKHAKRGWNLLMLGIFVEIVVSVGFAANDGWQARQTQRQIAASDPRKQPIESVRANVWLEIAGTKEAHFDLLRKDLLNTVELNFGRSELTKSNQWSYNLVCKDSQKLTGGVPVSTDWFLEFGLPVQNLSLFSKGIETVEMADKWDVVALVALFVPKDSEVLRGVAVVFVNFERKEYKIPRQKATWVQGNPTPMIGPSNSVGVRVIPNPFE